MIAGQMLDIITESTIANEETIKRIEEMKTGCLIKYACEAGAILGQATTIEKNAICSYARKIGQAFQIVDDVLDIEGNAALMGKAILKDANHGKTTFVSLYGLEEAKNIAKELTNQAKDNLEIFDNKADTLKDLADFILNRNH